MSKWMGRSALTLTLLSLGSAPTARAQAVDALNARVKTLESEVNELRAEVRELRAARGATVLDAPSSPTPPGARPPANAAFSGGIISAAPAATGLAKLEPSGQEPTTPTSGAGAGAPGAPSTALNAAATPRGRGDRLPDDIYAGSTPTTAAVAAIQGGRPVIETPDGQFTVNLLAVMHFDSADYLQEAAGPVSSDFRRGGVSTDTARARDLSSGSDFRRARLGLGGRAFGAFEYSFLYEFGGSGLEDAGHVQELWVQYSGLKPFHLRAGAFAPFEGLEDAGSTNGMLFLERPASSDVARSLAGGDYREAVQLVANTPRWFASAAATGRLVGVVNSSGSGVTQPYDSQLGLVGRVAVLPINQNDDLVHLGAHGSYVVRPSDSTGPDTAAGAVRYSVDLRERPELRVDGTRLVDTGAIDAAHAAHLGAEIALQHGPLMLQAEYDWLSIERRNSTSSNPDFSGFYVEGSWLLTGEKRRYNLGNFAFDGPSIRHNFDPAHGGWGTVELALRYSDLDLNFHAGAPGTVPSPDAVRGGEQRIVAAGLNWYLNPIVRVMLDWDYVHISRLSPNSMAFMTPTGAQVGQSYNVPSARVQLAF